MYFCPQCSYSFDIVKASKLKDTGEKTMLKNVSDAIKNKNKNMSKYQVGFSKKQLLRNKKYKKLSEEDKSKLEKLFLKNISSGAQFQCNNCGYVKQISKTIRLYQMDLENDTSTNVTENYELICQDQTLPRTHDYICKNINCITHKDKSKKEAVFYHLPNSYQLKYVCCVCFYAWS